MDKRIGRRNVVFVIPIPMLSFYERDVRAQGRKHIILERGWSDGDGTGRGGTGADIRCGRARSVNCGCSDQDLLRCECESDCTY